MVKVDRLYSNTARLLKAFYKLGPSTNAEVAAYLNCSPNAVLKSVVRCRADDLLRKVSAPGVRTCRHVLTLEGVNKLAKKRRIRQPSLTPRPSAMSRVMQTPNSVFSLAACMGLAAQPNYRKD